MKRWKMLAKKLFQDNQIVYQTRSEQDKQEFETKIYK